LHPETERRALAWIPAGVYVALIFALSSRPGSIQGRIPFHIFDKAAHLGEFAGLGLFLMVAFRGTLPRASLRHVVMLVLIVGLSIGVLDELYQNLIPGRAVEFLDWVADTIGVTVGSLIAVAHYRFKERRDPNIVRRNKLRGRNRRVSKQ
jgi:VanZ family protein